MKRKFTFLLLIFLAIMSLAACTGSQPAESTSADKAPTDSVETTDVTTTEAEATESAPTTATETSSGFPVVDSFNRYTEEKNIVLTELQNLISQDPVHGMMTIGLLAPAVMDLEMLPITFLPAPDAASVLGNLSCKVDATGETFSIEMVNSSSENLICGGKYDAASDSLYYESSLNGKKTAICEYTKMDTDTYIVQYYGFEQKKALRMVFDKKDMALGIRTQDAPDPTLYKNPPAGGFEFTKNDEFYIYMKDGKILEAVEKQ